MHSLHGSFGLFPKGTSSILTLTWVSACAGPRMKWVCRNSHRVSWLSSPPITDWKPSELLACFHSCIQQIFIKHLCMPGILLVAENTTEEKKKSMLGFISHCEVKGNCQQVGIYTETMQCNVLGREINQGRQMEMWDVRRSCHLMAVRQARCYLSKNLKRGKESRKELWGNISVLQRERMLGTKV